jgi:hypothetical protein
MIKKIRATGCNVLLVQKSILRDAVTDLSLHYLAKAKILVIKDVERDDIEFISKTLNCLPIANIEHFRAEKLGHADLVEEVSVGNGRVIFISFVFLCSGFFLYGIYWVLQNAHLSPGVNYYTEFIYTHRFVISCVIV